MNLGRFDIKNSYHAVFAVGLTLTAGALTMELKTISNEDAFVLGIGFTCAGLGEWLNHPYTSRPVFLPIVGPGIASGHSRRNCISGMTLLLLGLALVGIAGLRIYQSL